jgi:hypothetical protein
MGVFTWVRCSAAIRKAKAPRGIGESGNKTLELRPALVRREKCIAQAD